MTKVIWHVTMSLDGFIAGPDHAMEWAFEAWESGGGDADEIMRSTGAIVGGRGWYDAAARKYDGVDGIYGGRWMGPVFVLTNRPGDAPDDPKATFLSAGLEDALGKARAAAGGKNVEIFGANVARQCLEARELDEIVVHVAPVLLGDGVRLYGTPEAEPVRLERTAASEAGQIVSLRYAVRQGLRNQQP
jgi:dihydrofolate reductase